MRAAALTLLALIAFCSLVGCGDSRIDDLVERVDTLETEKAALASELAQEKLRADSLEQHLAEHDTTLHDHGAHLDKAVADRETMRDEMATKGLIGPLQAQVSELRRFAEENAMTDDEQEAHLALHDLNNKELLKNDEGLQKNCFYLRDNMIRFMTNGPYASHGPTSHDSGCPGGAACSCGGHPMGGSPLVGEMPHLLRGEESYHGAMPGYSPQCEYDVGAALTAEMPRDPMRNPVLQLEMGNMRALPCFLCNKIHYVKYPYAFPSKEQAEYWVWHWMQSTMASSGDAIENRTPPPGYKGEYREMLPKYAGMRILEVMMGDGGRAEGKPGYYKMAIPVSYWHVGPESGDTILRTIRVNMWFYPDKIYVHSKDLGVMPEGSIRHIKPRR